MLTLSVSQYYYYVTIVYVRLFLLLMLAFIVMGSLPDLNNK